MQAQSLYNDWWYLEVTADQNGARLFRRMRQINSQLSIEPIWQATGSTGDLQYELDTQTLTEFGSANVTVLASTANVGDSGLPTFVIANLNLDFDLSIDTIEHDLVEGWLGASPGPTVGDSTYFSIPRPGDVNVAHRFLTFTVTKPEGSTLTNVKVYVKGVDGFGVFTLSPNMPIVDESPGGIAVRENPNGSFAVRVTQEPSVFGTDPPPARRVRYQIRATVVTEAGETKIAERDSAEFRALWRMPQGFARYGQPPQGAVDIGGDDWCTLTTY